MRSIVIGCIILSLASASWGAVTYTGSLTSSSGELQGVGVWVNPGPTTIQWWVTNHGSYWHYKYTLTVPQADISHFIVEVSPSFLATDYSNATGGFGGIELGSYSASNGNPDIPGASGG